MIRRPPRSTRTDTLFPYTTLFRSQVKVVIRRLLSPDVAETFEKKVTEATESQENRKFTLLFSSIPRLTGKQVMDFSPEELADLRSEERRVGKECVSTCRSRWSPYD